MVKIIIATIVLIRLYLYLTWNSVFMYAQKVDTWHHMYTGVIIIVVSPLLPKKYLRFGIGIGLGLFFDEFIHLFHILGLTAATDYWSAKSVIATVISVLFFAILLKIVKLKKFTLT